MPIRGALLQPQYPGLVEVANDDNCDATTIESDNDTNGTDIDFDNQSDEDEGGEDGEHRDDNEEHAMQDDNHEIIEGRIAFDDGLPRHITKQPKMLETQLSEIDLAHLDSMISHFEMGGKGAYTEQNGLRKPLHSIAVMALLAEKEGIWGPFVVVALDSTLDKWVQEINALVPRFKVRAYWGTAANRKLLRKLWDFKSSIYTQDSPFHIFVTSYRLVLSEATYFQKMRWQFTILDDEKAIKSPKRSKIQAILGFHSFKSSYHESDGSQVDEPNTNQNAEHPSDAGVVRKRKVHSSRRSHERVDGLQHLCKFPEGIHGLSIELMRLLVPALPAVTGNDIEEVQPLHGIAFCLIRINLSILEARDEAHYSNEYSIFSRPESSHINGLLTLDECKEGYPGPGFVADSVQEIRLAEYVNTYSREQIIQRIRDPKALPYMSKLFDYRLYMWESWKRQKRMVENDPNFVLPNVHKMKSKAEYAYICGLQDRISRQRLRGVYNLTLSLQKYIIAACSCNPLDDNSLRQLKAKMTALQPGFQETCEALGCPREQLVWDTQPWW